MPRSSDEREKSAGAFLHFANAGDEFECYKHAHATRLAAISDALAAAFHMAPQDRKSLRAASLMHDLGEVVMEREYIGRAGVLTDEERVDLTRHPVIGEQECARAGADRPVQLLVRWHHEWWNGCGYPDALFQKQIPLGARILRVADAYASLTDHRPYRRAFSEADTREQLILRAGIEFDPTVVWTFLSLPHFDELRSFARADDVETVPDPEPQQEWNLFSSFMK